MDTQRLKVKTGNPEWYKARKSENIIPKPPNTKAADDLLYFTSLMTITQGPLAGDRFGDVMLPWQERIIRWIPAVSEIAIKCGKGPLALDTPLPTPDGWTTMGAIKPGDQLFDEKGQPCRVVSKSPVYLNSECFRVHFSDGTSIVADAEHLWQTTSRRTGGPLGPKTKPGPRKGEPWIRTTEEIYKTVLAPKGNSHNPQSVYNHRIDGPKGGSVLITKVEPVPSVPVQCIEVDSPSHLFLAGEGMTPTHNSGKSAMVAAIALGCVMWWVSQNKHRRGLVAIMAANVESAKIVFGHIHEAILADKHLKRAFKSNVQSRSLTHVDSGIKIQVLPPKLNRAVGLRPVLLIVDELHEAANTNEFEDALHQLKQGGKNWADFKAICITTSPVDRGKGYYVDWLTRARAVRDAKIENPRLLPALFEFPVLQRPDIDVEDPKYWYFGMPSLITTPGGKGTMDAEAMKIELEEAAQNIELTGITDYQNLLSQRLGIEAEERQGGGLTILAEFWPKCAVNIIPERFDEIYVAMDPSAGLSDPFAMIEVGKSQGQYYVRSTQWLTQEGYDRAIRQLRKLYDDAIKAKELRLCQTTEQITEEVLLRCEQIQTRQQMIPVYGGDAMGLAGFSERFRYRFGEYQAVPQGWQLMAAFECVTGIVHAGNLKHLGQPLLTANVKNLKVHNNRLRKMDDTDNNGMGWDKIDGAMALLSAIHLSETAEFVDVNAMIG